MTVSFLCNNIFLPWERNSADRKCLDCCADRILLPVREGVADQESSSQEASNNHNHPEYLLQLVGAAGDVGQAVDGGGF